MAEWTSTRLRAQSQAQAQRCFMQHANVSMLICTGLTCRRVFGITAIVVYCVSYHNLSSGKHEWWAMFSNNRGDHRGKAAPSSGGHICLNKISFISHSSIHPIWTKAVDQWTNVTISSACGLVPPWAAQSRKRELATLRKKSFCWGVQFLSFDSVQQGEIAINLY